MVCSDFSPQRKSAMDGKVFFKSLQTGGKGIGGRWGGPPMAGVGGENLRGEFRVNEILISMVVESYIIYGKSKPFKKDIDPAGFVEIVIFEKIDDGIGMEIQGFDMIEETEKRSGLCPLANGDVGLFFDEMISFFGSVEEVGEFYARIGGVQKIAMARFFTKSKRPLFMGACGREEAVAHKDFDLRLRRAVKGFSLPKKHN